ncbi:thiamine phosphate synthase [Sulfurovum sp.]|uniref:thiamine phosphate synthase n=1 Tax=Sulfurovum sp. TaxID=1969726 RepID=UPI002868179B|nr:thiamine phosphate synthase [Sulfurovum sp.]
MIRYAITDPLTLDFNYLEHDLKRFSQKASMIVYRDKDNANYAYNAKLFVENAKGFEKVLLHREYLQANTFGADGVHLSSTQFRDISKAKKLGLFVVISTHTPDEAKLAKALGADMITYSPVFETPNKGKALGLKALEALLQTVDIPVIALGGILTQEQIDSCEKSGASGFASIRYFAD